MLQSSFVLWKNGGNSAPKQQAESCSSIHHDLNARFCRTCGGFVFHYTRFRKKCKFHLAKMQNQNRTTLSVISLPQAPTRGLQSAYTSVAAHSSAKSCCADSESLPISEARSTIGTRAVFLAECKICLPRSESPSTLRYGTPSCTCRFSIPRKADSTARRMRAWE